VPPGGIVGAFDKAEAGHLCLDLWGATAALEQFAFEDGKDALAQGVVPGSGFAGPRTGSGVPDRAHRGRHAGFLAALAESERGILAAPGLAPIRANVSVAFFGTRAVGEAGADVA
jgi:hypothetical protein